MSKMITQQMDIFSLLSMADELFPLEQQETEYVEENYSSYLQREERILSLLREKEKARKPFVRDEFLDGVNYKSYSQKTSYKERYAYLTKRSKSFLKDSLLNLCAAEYKNDTLQKVFPYGGLEGIYLTSGYSYDLCKAVLKRKGTDLKCVIRFDLTVDGKEQSVLVPVGPSATLTSRQNHASYRMTRGGGGYETVVDSQRYFCDFYIACQLKKRIIESMKKSLEQEDEMVPVVEYLETMQKKMIADLSQFETVYLASYMKHPFLENYLSEEGHSFEYVSLEEAAKKGVRALSMEAFLPLWFFSEDMPYMGSNGRSGRGTKDLTATYGEWTKELLCVVMDHILEMYNDEVMEEDFLAALKKEHATSFVTKKNIPQKMLREMENSPFNQHFGYVEFDAECDVEKAKNLYKEFRALADFIGLSKHSEVSLRFRKLGNHHATGLYYPFYKCICVDPRYPSSFSHELFHMIDYENGKLSSKARFSKIVGLYRMEFEKGLGNASLKGKYDKQYYFRREEIFARCAEIYLVRFCGIENSVVKPDLGFAYPASEALDREIKAYFEELVGGCLKAAS